MKKPGLIPHLATWTRLETWLLGFFLSGFPEPRQEPIPVIQEKKIPGSLRK